MLVFIKLTKLNLQFKDSVVWLSNTQLSLSVAVKDFIQLHVERKLTVNSHVRMYLRQSTGLR